MSNKNKKLNENDEKYSLDDARRVKALSPGMLVFKRFIRNRLAIAGTIIIIVMFMFAFLGPLVLTNYSEDQAFNHYVDEDAKYAEAKINRDYISTVKEGMTFEQSDLTAFNGILFRNQTSFENNGRKFNLEEIGEEIYNIKLQYTVASYIKADENAKITLEPGITLDSSFSSKASTAIISDEDTFEYDESTYYINKSKKEQTIYRLEDIAIITKDYFNVYEKDTVVTYEEKIAAQTAIINNKSEFTIGDTAYRLTNGTVGEFTYTKLEKKVNGEFSNYAEISRFYVNPPTPDVFFTMEYRDNVRNVAATLNTGHPTDTFKYADTNGEEIEYSVTREDMQFVIRKETSTYILLMNDAPSGEHLLGTDKYGMDIFTRLMYGGRVSLTVGFIVIFIEIIIGVIMGGISGYFSGVIDTIIMRIVDVMNCIPTLPLYIILGTALEHFNLEETQRLFLLMVVLGLTGWPGIARVVRGQILSLREQDFMLAAEALGLSTSRRIFKHLIPNVIPQLIVYATMGLGSVILTEATLSYLNLSVKYPSASWGNMINTVNDGYTMANFWFAWIPAGMLILLTVLGFNFIGDGLRDAFDPKMKR